MSFTQKKETIFTCNRFSVEKLVVDVLSKKRTFYTINKPDAVGIIAEKDNGLFLVEQYRPLLGRSVLEIPAGKLEADEDKISAAIREIQEETGFKIECISEFEGDLFDHSITNECLTIFEAKLGEYVGQSLDDEEADLRVKFIQIDQVKERICNSPSSFGGLDRLLLKLWMYQKKIG